LQCIFAAKCFRGERLLTDKLRGGAILLVDGGMGKYETAEATARRLLHMMGAGVDTTVYYSDTDTPGREDPIEDAVTAGKIAQLAELWQAEES